MRTYYVEPSSVWPANWRIVAVYGDHIGTIVADGICNAADARTTAKWLAQGGGEVELHQLGIAVDASTIVAKPSKSADAYDA